MLRKSHKISFLIITLFFLSPVQASEKSNLVITTWNLEHMMSKNRFDEWKKVCSTNVKRPKYITYCNALNGTEWTETDCHAQLTKKVKTWEDFSQKIRALKGRAKEINADIFALQEVTNAEALALIFSPADFILKTTEFNIPQNIGFAIRKGIFNTVDFKTIEKVSQNTCNTGYGGVDCKDRITRPGFELIVSLNGVSYHILNVHLKSGCRFYSLAGVEEKDIRKPKHNCESLEEKTKRILMGCRTLHKQVKALDEWVDEQALNDNYFAIVGDFNRDFSNEIRKFQARLDGSDSSSPIISKTHIGSLLKEISDSHPQNGYLQLIDQDLETHKLGQYKSCHGNIDWFLIGEKLFRDVGWTSNNKPKSFGRDYFPYSADKVKASDHCPVTLIMPIILH